MKRVKISTKQKTLNSGPNFCFKWSLRTCAQTRLTNALIEALDTDFPHALSSTIGRHYNHRRRLIDNAIDLSICLNMPIPLDMLIPLSTREPNSLIENTKIPPGPKNFWKWISSFYSQIGACFKTILQTENILLNFFKNREGVLIDPRSFKC